MDQPRGRVPGDHAGGRIALHPHPRVTPADVTVLRQALGVVQRVRPPREYSMMWVDVDDARRAQDALTMLIKQDCQLTEVSLEPAFCGCRWRELCR